MNDKGVTIVDPAGALLTAARAAGRTLVRQQASQTPSDFMDFQRRSRDFMDLMDYLKSTSKITPMATIRIKFKPSSVEGKEGTLSFQIIQKRVIRQITTAYKVFPSEWDSCSESIRLSLCPAQRTKLLQSIQSLLLRDKRLLEKVLISLEEKKIGYTADDVVRLFHQQMKGQSFFNFTQEVIGQLKRLGKIRTSETYTVALGSFMRFNDGHDVLLDDIHSDLMLEYEAWLKAKNVSMNTVSFYMRILRAVYNRGVEKGLTLQRYPFRHVYTGTEKTLKRAIPLKAIKRIKELDLSLTPSADFARDLFLFSFYTRGMSFIDLAYLKKSDLKNGILSYRRKKTGQQLHIRWEKCMQEIVDKYNTAHTDYLLPVITVAGSNGRRQYQNALHLINHRLKKITVLAGLAVPLTTYVSRHAWASIAKDKNIPLSVISEGMGHDSESTTQIYLASLDHSVIDKANKLILKGL